MRSDRRFSPLLLPAAMAALGALLWPAGTQPPGDHTLPGSTSPQAPDRPVPRLFGPPTDSAPGNDTNAAAGSDDAPATRITDREQPADDVPVHGIVQTTLGDIVEGETVRLYSPSLNMRYTTTSNHLGELLFPGVRPAADYALSVSPEGLFEPYEREGLVLDTASHAVTVVLEPVPVGLLQGRIVDAEGHPVSGFDIRLQSRYTNRGLVNARTDPVGLFEVEDFPAGRFEVLAREPLLRIDGLHFDPGAGEVLTLVVDHGPHSLMGTVYDENGQPLVGAAVFLSWSDSRGDGRSVIERRTLTGFDGAFTIAGLGPGRHDLRLSLTQQGTALRRNVDVGADTGEIILYLETSQASDNPQGS